MCAAIGSVQLAHIPFTGDIGYRVNFALSQIISRKHIASKVFYFDPKVGILYRRDRLGPMQLLCCALVDSLTS